MIRFAFWLSNILASMIFCVNYGKINKKNDVQVETLAENENLHSHTHTHPQQSL